MLLYAQLLLLFFVVDVATVKDSSLAALSKATLPLALQETALLLALVVIAFAGYYLIPYTSKMNVPCLWVLGGVEAFFWVISLVTMWFKKVLGTHELFFGTLVCLLILACTAGICILQPRKEKGRWLSVQVFQTACVVTLFAAAAYVALRYHNELISAGINIVMFALCAVCMLLYWWFSDSVNHWASVLVVVGQAITFIYCFSALCRKKDMADLFGVALKAIRGKEVSNFLTWTALVLVFLLAVALLLHYLKNLQIIGKYASVILSCTVLVVILSMGKIAKAAENSTGVKSDEAVKHEQYKLYVMKDDPAQTGADVVGYVIGYALEEGRPLALGRARDALRDAIGADLNWKEYLLYDQLLNAFYSGEVDAMFCEASRDEIFDDALAIGAELQAGLGEEDTEEENAAYGHVFTADTRAIETIEIEFIEEEIIDVIGEIDPDNVDPIDTPTPTLPEGVTATPTPTLAPGVSPTPKPTKKPAGTATPTPTTMPKKPRKDNSGKDLTQEPFLIYISGIDQFGAVSVRSRSDVNLLMAVNPKTKKIAIVTTPRDAYVHIPGITSSRKDKLTHAGLYGVDYSIAALENLYGSISVDFYIRLNFSGMITLINMIGGVDAECYYDFTTASGKYTFRKGLLHLDGAAALAFARERKTISAGDAGRAKHQMEVIKGVINKLSSTSLLSNYQSLIKGFSSCTQTDMTVSQLVSLATMQLGDGAKWSITSYSTSGDSSYQYCYSYKGKKLWVSLLKSDSIKKAADLLNSVLK